MAGFIAVVFHVVFFFFKQKTAYEVRISDWSSDVCSSDLAAPCLGWQRRPAMPMEKTFDPAAIEAKWSREWESRGLYRPERPDEIGRASCRERVCQYV